jgi:uncharacterized membrane protein
LLAFGSSVNAGVEEGAKQATIAQKQVQEFVVIYVERVETRGVKQVVAVNKDGDAPAIA